MTSKKVVIVGGGQAGLQTAAFLRQEGYTGNIILFLGEKIAPYQRPPLSKEFLLGNIEEQNLFFRSTNYYKQNNIELRSSTVKMINCKEQFVTDDSDDKTEYDFLVLALGGKNRVLPQTLKLSMDRCYYLRTLAEAKRLRAQLIKHKVKKYLIVGGGFIGLEVASVMRELGHSVTLLEVGDQLMGRSIPNFFSKWFMYIHRKNGVRIFFKSKILTLQQTVDQINIEFDYSEDIKNNQSIIKRNKENYDAIIIGIGSDPETALASQSHINCQPNGIIVNEAMKTSAPYVYAVGDCTYHQNSYNHSTKGNRIRLESVQNAIDQARVVAANIVGKKSTYNACPWFWTTQHQMNLQIAGLYEGYDSYFWRGNSADDLINSFTIASKPKLSCYFFLNKRLIAHYAVNSPDHHLVSRKLLEKNISPTPEQVRDINFDFKKLLSS